MLTPGAAPLRIILFNRQEMVRHGLRHAVAWMQDNAYSADLCAMTELALAEALNNIVEHAYSEDVIGVIELLLEGLPDGVKCTLIDEGQGLPGGEIPSDSQPDTDVALDDLPEGGFGWHILLSLTETVDYERSFDTNRLSFTMRQEAEVSSTEPKAGNAHR